MKSLMIQDAFEPYYADRKRFPTERRPLVASMKEKVQAPKETRPASKPATQADKTTEH